MLNRPQVLIQTNYASYAFWLCFCHPVGSGESLHVAYLAFLPHFRSVNTVDTKVQCSRSSSEIQCSRTWLRMPCDPWDWYLPLILVAIRTMIRKQSEWVGLRGASRGCVDCHPFAGSPTTQGPGGSAVALRTKHQSCSLWLHCSRWPYLTTGAG